MNNTLEAINYYIKAQESAFDLFAYGLIFGFSFLAILTLIQIIRTSKQGSKKDGF